MARSSRRLGPRGSGSRAAWRWPTSPATASSTSCSPTMPSTVLVVHGPATAPAGLRQPWRPLASVPVPRASWPATSITTDEWTWPSPPPAVPTLDVLYGAGSGGFTRRTVAAGRALNVLIAVDLNADGLARARRRRDRPPASYRSFVAASRASPLAGTRAAGTSPRGIASADINQDGTSGSRDGGELWRVLADRLLGRRQRLHPDGSLGGDPRRGAGAGASGGRATSINDGAADIAAGVQSAAQPVAARQRDAVRDAGSQLHPSARPGSSWFPATMPTSTRTVSMTRSATTPCGSTAQPL